MDGKWLTYAELGELMGGKTANAGRQRANRKKYRKQAGNDGRARVFVPAEDVAQLEAAEHPADQVADHAAGQQAGPVAGHPHDHPAKLLAQLERLQAEMVEMAQRLGASENRAAAAEAVAGELRQDRDAWRVQAEVAQEQVQEALRQLAETRRELAERLTERRPGLIERIAAVLRRAG